ncbi:arsenate reductase family protein [Periweissella cryptocerci]|uniref:Arsenate reductase family protein n=1 Tax=Periweissella cryptocerci TaxID=2506420 RepID=A0A4V1AIP3_9LACO|nr:arsenate reductase family protein [Periweissella cryptocerci]QBO36205.1 arsenate reductase family protein [Periweissella cryptocerci]
MLFVCYAKCSTCAKARSWMNENKIEYHERDIKGDKPNYEELKVWYKLSGLPLKRFFNTSGLVYRDLGLKDKLATMTEDEQLQLLATDGMLVKRPLVVDGDTVLVGFREKEWAAHWGVE